MTDLDAALRAERRDYATLARAAGEATVAIDWAARAARIRREARTRAQFNPGNAQLVALADTVLDLLDGGDDR